jgi:hypothetical protein
MSVNKEKLRKIVIGLIPYRTYIAIGLTAFGLWLHFMFLPLWQLYFIPAVIGGLIAGEKPIKSFWIGFIGMWIALILYMNVVLFTGIEAIDALLQAAAGISGLGLLVHILVLLIWASFSGMGGMVGAYIYLFFPFYEQIDTGG